jgi:hypothetical protein
MNGKAFFSVAAWLMLTALAATACSVDGSMGPGVEIEATQFQVAEPEGADGTLQAGGQVADVTLQAGLPLDSITMMAPSTPQVFKALCMESQLAAPTLLEPEADATILGNRPSFAWSELGCSLWGWEFQLCSTEDCGSVDFIGYETGSSTTYPSILEPGTTYYWRVAALLTSGGPRGPWSEIRRIRVVQTCSAGELAAPTLFHPDADAIDSGANTWFSWSDDLECETWGWDFELCATEDCGDVEMIVNCDLYSNISMSGALAPGSTHYWRVAARLTEPPGGTLGPWSETRRLTIMDACSDASQLAAPVLEWPADGSTQDAVESVAGHRPTLAWVPTGACQPSEFLVELFIDPESGPVLVSHRTGAPLSRWKIDQDLQIGVTYFWRVAAMLGETVGPFSEPRTFTTIGVPEGQPGAVMGRVWSDVCALPPGWDWGDPIPSGCEVREGGLSANGEMDAGESGLAGVTVNHTRGACPPGTDAVLESVTDASGDYLIYLPPGSFCVWLDASAANNADVLGGGRGTYPACYYDTMDPCTVELTDGEILDGFNFGWELHAPEMGGLGSISGTVWMDLNANGAHDALEHGLANVEVRLTCVGCPGAGTPAFTQTDSGGNYSFGSLASATYSVEVAKEFPANLGILTSGGWTQPPVSGTWAAIQLGLAGGEDRGGVDFGWSYLTLLRPAFQLRSTLQFFQALPTVQIYRRSTPTPTPRFYAMPTTTMVFIPAPKPTLYIMPTATRLFILPTKPPVQILPTATPPALIKPG